MEITLTPFSKFLFYYKETDDKKKAEALFNEIRKDYPNAVNHRGKPLADIIGK